MRGRAPHYPGLDDPRAAMARYWDAYRYTGELKRRFHISSRAMAPLDDISRAIREAATALTKDPYFFGGLPCGQSPYKPPEAPPIPGIIRVPLSKPSKVKHPT